MSRKQLVTLVIIMLLPLLVMLFFFSFLSIQVQRNNELIIDAVDKRISNIVLATLSKVRDDLGLIYDAPKNETSDLEGSDSKVKDNIKIDGDVSLSTFGDSFYINNRRYEKGDFIAPYGLTIYVGHDLVIFDDLKGGITFFGQQLERNIPASSPSGGSDSPALPLNSLSGV